MPQSTTSRAAPEIITPAAQSRLDALSLKQELEGVKLAQLESLAHLMDARFNVPLLPVPIGLDTIIGLIPGIGDTISLGVSAVIVMGARNLKVPKRHLIRMLGNIFIDWLIGLIPIIGDVFDIGWRGNLRNVKIAREHLDAHWAKERNVALRG